MFQIGQRWRKNQYYVFGCKDESTMIKLPVPMIEEKLDKLFFRLCPKNTDITDILRKVSTLNDFYSTNIFFVYPVAKHILSLGINAGLKAGDVTLVNDIKQITINGTERNFYSFASKYCSHHNPLAYPIYDSYVDAVLRYFRNRTG